MSGTPGSSIYNFRQMSFYKFLIEFCSDFEPCLRTESGSDAEFTFGKRFGPVVIFVSHHFDVAGEESDFRPGANGPPPAQPLAIIVGTI